MASGRLTEEVQLKNVRIGLGFYYECSKCSATFKFESLADESAAPKYCPQCGRIITAVNVGS